MKRNVEEIYKQKLCCSCGFCIGVCPHNSISYEIDKHGFFEPVINKNTCTECEICYEHCPGIKDIKEYSSVDEKLCYGYSTDGLLRWNSSSGGLATELLCFLLEENIVDFVSVVSNRKREENPKILLTNDPDVVREFKTSKYCPVVFGEILESLKKIEGTVALLGLPCQINALKAFADKRTWLRKKIKFLFSLLCNHVPSYTATDYLVKNLGFQKWDTVLYRGNGWPGEMMFFNDKERIKLLIPYRKTFAVGFGIFFKNRRCSICNDPFAKSADMVFGDAYFLETETSGATLCFVRNNEAFGLLSKMANGKKIVLCEGPGIDIVKRFYRTLFDREEQYSRKIRMMKYLGLPVPEYFGNIEESFYLKKLLKFVLELNKISLGKYKQFWKFLFWIKKGRRLSYKIEKY